VVAVALLAAGLLAWGFSRGTLRIPFVYLCVSGALAAFRTYADAAHDTLEGWWIASVWGNLAVACLILVIAMVRHAGSRSQEPMLY
jgi:hypothetical protein